MGNLHRSVGRTSLAVALVAAASPAMAQQQTAPTTATVQEEAPSAPTQAGALTAPSQSAPGGPTSAVAPAPQTAGDIIVTANKRAENIQNVPLAVSVVTTAQLQSSGVRQFQDLGKIAPSLVVRTAQHPVNANVSLRGVGTFAFGIGVEPSVAVLVDEVPLAFQARAFTDLPDVERIEVLRGPQSTLYGKSASAGLVNIITREPTDTLRIRANALATTDSEYGGNVSVSGPVGENLGYVVSGSYSNYNGNVRNVTLNREVGGRETFNTRGKLRWEPTDDIKITLSGNYLNGNTTVGRVYAKINPNARFLGVPSQTLAVFSPGVTFGKANQDLAENYLSRTRYEGGGGYLRAEVGLGSHTLVSISSIDKFSLHDFNDADGTATPIPQGANVEIGQFKSNLVTQEVRLLSPSDDTFRYTVGAYFARTRFERPFYRGPAFSLANWFATSFSRQIAAFVQADWEIVPKLTLTGGARVQNEKVAYTYRDILNGNAFFSGDANDTADTYRASARYQITPTINFFGTYATGYKGQTFDLTTGFNAARAAAGAIRPERSKDIEFGTRAQFLDRRLTFNLTYFNTKFNDLQAQTIETVGVQQNYRLTNVGGLRTKGLELDVGARIGDDLNLTGSVTDLNARYTDYQRAQCYPGQTAAAGCITIPATPTQGALTYQDLTNHRAVQSPKWKFAINGDYSPALTNDLRAIAQASWSYTSNINYATTDPDAFQPAYHIVNLGLGIRSEDRRWEVVASVNNVFDQQYYPSLVNQASYFSNAQATYGYLPRDFRRYGGLRLGVNF